MGFDFGFVFVGDLCGGLENYPRSVRLAFYHRVHGGGTEDTEIDPFAIGLKHYFIQVSGHIA